MPNRDVLLLVDVLDDFDHEDGTRLLESFAERHPALVKVLDHARRSDTPIVFANDSRGPWDSHVAPRLIERALNGPGGALVRDIAPRAGERFVVKPRYSAFDHTPLDLILDDLDCERLVIAGMSTEGCVAQTAIAARELGYKVSIAADACATTDPELEETALRYLVDVAGVRRESSSVVPSA
jgi:nicotinamidase-related amidase